MRASLRNCLKQYAEMRRAAGDKIGEFAQERLFLWVTNIPLSKTSDELEGMDFVEYGGRATLLHLRDTFPRYATGEFIGNKKSRRRRLVK